MNSQSIFHFLKDGGQLTKAEALVLAEEPAQALQGLADQVRRHFCGDGFHLCSIINGKSGRCSEDCKYCAQSSHYQTHIETYGLLPAKEIIQTACGNYQQGVHRFSIVTSGKGLTDEEFHQICRTVEALKKTCSIQLCASHGFLTAAQFRQLKAAGISRYHNNLETSQSFFPQICTTHTYADKINIIKAAQQAGLEVCSGGIIGLGETMADRIDLAITLRELNVTSIPINILNPIPGTPLGNQPTLQPEEIQKTMAIFRLLNPAKEIRLAGGRTLLPDRGSSLFNGGINAVITGDMLTTAGISIATDKGLAQAAGYTL